MTTGLPLMKNILTTLSINVLLLFRLSATMSAADKAIQKKIHRSGTTALKFQMEKWKM